MTAAARDGVSVERRGRLVSAADRRLFVRSFAWAGSIFSSQACIEIGFTTALRYSGGIHQDHSDLDRARSRRDQLLSSWQDPPRPFRSAAAYAAWGALGAAGTAIIGIVAFNEPIEGPRLFFIGLIIVAVVGLKLVTE